jgi:hypothetical protein
MPRKKFKSWDEVKTANDAIDFAVQNGAEIHYTQNHTKLKVPGRGSAIINQNEGELGKHSKKNIARIFKLIGLLSVVLPLVYSLADSLLNIFGYRIVLF